ADPPALLLVPPDVALALAPRAPLGVGGGSVVEDAAVQRPCPAPVVGYLVLLAAGRAVRRAVDPTGEDTRVDPAPAGRGAVGSHVGEGFQQLPGPLTGEVVAVDLPQDRLGVDLAVVVLRIVPGEVEQGPVALVGRAGEPVPDAEAEL